MTVILMSNSCTKSVLDVLPEEETIEIGESTQTGDDTGDDSTDTGEENTGNDGDGEDDGTIDIVIDDPEVGEDIIITF